MADLIHYEATVALLKESSVGSRADIPKKPEKVVALTRVLKGLLARRISIGNLNAIVEAFDPMRRRGMAEDAIVEQLAHPRQN